MQRTITCLAAAAAFGIGSLAAPASAAIVGVSDSIQLDGGPISTCANPDPACTTPIAVPAPGWRLDRNVVDGGTGSGGHPRALALENGILIARASGSGVTNTRADARFTETYQWTGPTGPAFVSFFIDTHNLGVFAPGSLPGTTRTSTFAFDIRVDGTTVAALDWYAQVVTDSSPLTDVLVTPAPLGFDPTPIAMTLSSFVPDQVVIGDGPAGAILVDLGPFTTGQIFTLDYHMWAIVMGNMPFGEGFSGIGDPFSIPSGPGIDFFGNAVAVVPAPAALALFGLGLVALVRRRAR